MRSRFFAMVVLGFAVGPIFAFASDRQIDTKRSSLTIHVEKSGLFSAAGHEHTVMAPIESGFISDGSEPHVTFRVASATLMILPEEHQVLVQHTMQEKVLESARYPDISFVSQTITSNGESRWTVSGTLSLHGQTRSVQVAVAKLGEAYVGNATIKQTDFGVQPVSAAAGTVKVKNELKIDFSITTLDAETSSF